MTPAVAPAERLHALDAVRAYALLLGVVLHACAAFLQDFPMAAWRLTPELGPALLYYSIHIFRMSAFFLMAGFFGRMVLERRGTKAFVRDRAWRILVPLVGGLPVVLIVISLFLLLGAWPHGGLAYLNALPGNLPPPGSAAPRGGGGVNLVHLWFLYYLLMFYLVALGLRALLGGVDARGAWQGPVDRCVAFVMRGIWGPVLLALPAALHYWPTSAWNEWTGLPAPASIVPDLGAFIGYGMPFGLGWLLHRQTPALLALRSQWWLYLLLFAGLTALCLGLIGTTPRWQGPNLAGAARALYIGAYMTAVWCGVFAAVGTAVRFLSAPSTVNRYLADASYWIYLMHMGPIVCLINLLRPYHWPWPLMLLTLVGGTMLILLPSYHYLVRFTWVGALLNGRRHVRPLAPTPTGAAAVP